MPRIAASMAVLAAVAISIGFNATRYPVVWEMVAEGRYPEQPAEPSEASSVSSSLASADSAPSDEVGSSAARVLETTQESPAWGSFYESTENMAPAEDAFSGSRDLGPTAVAPLTPAVAPFVAVDPIPRAESMSPMTAVASTENQPAVQAGPAECEPDRDRDDDPLAVNDLSPMKPAEPAGKYAAGPSWGARQSGYKMVPMTGLGAVDEPSGWPAEWEAAGLRAAAAGSGSTTATRPPDRAETVRPLPPLDRVWTAPAAADEEPLPDGRIPIYPSTDSRGA